MNVQPAVLHEEIETRYLAYALSTIVSRALPDVRDGLKPVHRRILFAMHSIGAEAAARFVKSARVVGEVIGKYHPHGDAAVYHAMVRMAQDFALRYPLVDGQGNFGSLDGDNAAAMRYTEARTSPITEEFFHDLDQQTVEFQSNYDATLQEPAVLPVRFPNLLVNGSSGIAVGMSTSFPPHNLTEVCNALLACIDRQDIATRELLRIIPAPDFPTGGEVLNSAEELVEIYRHGHGAVRLRGQYRVETGKRGRVMVVLTSIPYSVNKARLIERIAQLIETRKFTLVTNVWDESTEDVRIVLELKNAQMDPEKVMAFLYKYTPMEIQFPLNFTCLSPEGVPERMSIKELLLHFLDFRKEVVTRRLDHEARQIRDRIHVLEGYAALFDRLDEAITLIRRADQRSAARSALMERFGLDTRQADAILELRLHSLVRIEESKLRQEMSERRKRLEEIDAILANDVLVWQEVRRELAAIRQRYGDARRTQLVQIVPESRFSVEDFVEHEDIWIVLTRMGRIKRLKSYDPETVLLREEDRMLTAFPANTRDRVAFFSNLGRVYITTAFDLPAAAKGYGEPIQTVFSFQDGEKTVTGLALNREDAMAATQRLEKDEADQDSPGDGIGVAPTKGTDRAPTIHQLGLFSSAQEDLAGEATAPKRHIPLMPSGADLILVTRGGKGMRLPCANLAESTIRAGRQVMKMDPGDELIAVLSGDAPLLLLASGKRVLVLKRQEVSLLSGPSKGVKLMTVDPAGIHSALLLSPDDRIQLVSSTGRPQEYPADFFLALWRGGKGRIVKGGIDMVEIIRGEKGE
jgi:DNA gyrase/topoisomerase IV subunit A